MARANHYHHNNNNNNGDEDNERTVTEQSPLLSDHSSEHVHANPSANDGERKADLTIVEYAASLSKLKLYTILGSIWVRFFVLFCICIDITRVFFVLLLEVIFDSFPYSFSFAFLLVG